MDVYPSVWRSLEKLIKSGFLVSPKEVQKEINRKDNQLGEWAKKQKDFFKEPTPTQISLIKEILAKYPSIVKVDAKNGADPFVIALAIEMARNKQKTLFPVKRIVVTEEKLRGERIRIPYICQGYSIECIDVIEMFRAEELKF
jgi:hypothetical protein